MIEKVGTGGYQNLVVYKLAVLVSDLTKVFCDRYLDQAKDRRTIEQMVQAARSGKQNIVEGSLEKGVEGNIKLTGVARASYGELLEDYRDFLRQRGLTVWGKDDPRVWEIRKTREAAEKEINRSYNAYMSNWTNSPERYANLMITLISKESYLLDRLLRAQEEKFVREGGFRENLFRKRNEYREKNKTN